MRERTKYLCTYGNSTFLCCFCSTIQLLIPFIFPIDNLLIILKIFIIHRQNFWKTRRGSVHRLPIWLVSLTSLSHLIIGFNNKKQFVSGLVDTQTRPTKQTEKKSSNTMITFPFNLQRKAIC